MRPPNTITISAGELRISASSKLVKRQTLLREAVRPAIKWAGGKQWLAPAARQLAPANWGGTYFEPFLGGGSYFFALGPSRALLSDTNSELIATYQALQNDPDLVIEELDSYPNGSKFFYYLRDARPRSAHTLAARFLYLNRTCWNGLYRVNRKGKFNTPFGNYSDPTICDEERIGEAGDSLANAVLRVGDFESMLRLSERGDFAYCDPPYITGHKNNGFHKYNASLFAWADQERLAKVAITLKNRGVHVLISNANHRSVVQLYRGFLYYRLTRPSLIAADRSNRGTVSEALFSSYPILGCESEVIQ
jgi:DNA adenine methylase